MNPPDDLPPSYEEVMPSRKKNFNHNDGRYLCCCNLAHSMTGARIIGISVWACSIPALPFFIVPQFNEVMLAVNICILLTAILFCYGLKNTNQYMGFPFLISLGISVAVCAYLLFITLYRDCSCRSYNAITYGFFMILSAWMFRIVCRSLVYIRDLHANSPRNSNV